MVLLRRHWLLMIAAIVCFMTELVTIEPAEAQPRPGMCSNHDECDDRIYCNGLERCRPGTAGADARGCVVEPLVCPPDQVCSEALRSCGFVPVDADGDGVASHASGGIDCDDADPRRYPGAIEVCDAEGRDEDCNLSTPGDKDSDGDGYVDARCYNVTWQ